MGNESSSHKQSAEEVEFLNAVQSGAIDSVRALVEARPDLLHAHAHTKDGLNAYHVAAKEGHVEILELLYKVWVDTDQVPPVNARTKNGYTAMMLACENGQAEAMQVLLTHGASITSADMAGNTCLHLAALRGHVKVVEILVSQAPPKNDDEPRLTVNVRNTAGLTPLHFAAWKNQVGVITSLLEHGARYTKRCTSDALGMVTCNAGSTALHLAAMKGAKDAAEVIIEAYVQAVKTDLRAKRGTTAIDPRAITDSYDMIPLKVALNCKQRHMADLLNPEHALEFSHEDEQAHLQATAEAIAQRRSEKRITVDPHLPSSFAHSLTFSTPEKPSQEPGTANTSAPSPIPYTPSPHKAPTGARSCPTYMICPITNAMIEDPVTASDGVSYERSAIEMWFELGNTEFPGTGVRILHKKLAPNASLRDEIHAWKSS